MTPSVTPITKPPTTDRRVGIYIVINRKPATLVGTNEPYVKNS